MLRIFHVYILASAKYGTLYIGSTANLASRLAQHRAEEVASFTRRYRIRRLVYVEPYATLREARARERQLKAWRREWKVELIEHGNREWRDLAEENGVWF